MDKTNITCEVISCEELSGYISRVLLQPPQGKSLTYQAGQYLEILQPGIDPRPFSIANAPIHTDSIELHIRHLPQNDYAKKLLSYINQTKQLTIRGPFGKMIYHPEYHLPIIFVAVGTGLAPFKAIIEEMFNQHREQPVFLYWGVRHRGDLYWHEQLSALAKKHSYFHYIPVLSQPSVDDHWQGETGWVHEVVLKQHQDFSAWQVYASGHPEMVFAAHKAFLMRGLKEPYFYSDLMG